LLKRIAILMVALCWTFATNPLGGATPTSMRSRTSATRSGQRAVTLRNAGARRRVRRHRRRAMRWSPWHLSSFGQPGEGDNPTGEDPQVREAALQALGRWNGSVVVVDPNTGRILSIVNQKLALSGAFTPCSTFKPVVALAALKEGIISPDTKLRVFGRSGMNVTGALAHSNNMFFAKLGEMLGFPRVSQYAHEFGLGERAGWNIPDESTGRFPPEPPKQGGVGLLTSFGQDIEITPLQLASIVSAIANGGTMYYLQYPRTPEEAAQFEPKVRRQLDDFQDYFADVKQGMAAAVRYGTARSAYDPDDQILGKTGTCSEDGARLGWFASYSNLGESQPKYVVVVLLRGGRMMFGPHAAEIAGKVFHDLYGRQKTFQAEKSATTATRSQ
jgi:penicillin-binding protein 2